MLIRLIFTALVVGIMVNYSTANRHCTEDAVDSCFKPLVDHPYNEGSFFPTKTEREMKAICGKYFNATQCMKGFLKSCHIRVKQTMESLENVYTYICKESRSEYLKHRVCFNNLKLNKEGKHCNATAQKRLRELQLNKSTMSIEEIRSAACGMLNYYLKCVYDVTEKHCGEEAALWIDNVLMKAIEPLTATLKCVRRHPGLLKGPVVKPLTSGKIDKPEAEGGTMISSRIITVGVGVGLAGIATIVILSLVVLYVYRRKRRTNGVQYVTMTQENSITS